MPQCTVQSLQQRKNHPAPNVKSAEVEKPWSRSNCLCLSRLYSYTCCSIDLCKKTSSPDGLAVHSLGAKVTMEKFSCLIGPCML